MIALILFGIFGYIALFAILMYGERGIGRGNKLSVLNNYGKGGGGSTTVVQSSPASAGSSKEAVEAWVQSLPQVYETQLKYAPQEAAQTLQMAQQYAAPLGLAMRQANEALYPGTAALQESLVGQANEQMNMQQLPAWQRRQYEDQFRAQLGSNVSAPIGADYLSRGMQQQLYNQRQQGQNLALALSGRQPLASGSIPSTTNFASGFTPGNVMNYLGGMGTKTSTTTGGGGGGGLFGGLFGGLSGM